VNRAPDLAYSFCSLSAMLLFKRVPAAVALLTSISVLFKEQGIMTAPMVLAVDALYTHRASPFPQKRAKRLFYKIVFYCALLSSLLYLRLRAIGFLPPTFQEQDNPASFLSSAAMRVANRNYHYALNIWLLLAPDWLCFDWAMGCVPLIVGCRDPRLLSVLALWFFLLLITFRALVQRNRIVLLALSLLILPFAPAANVLFNVGFVIAERNLYLSVLGFAMIVAHCFDRMRQKCGLLTLSMSAFVLIAFVAKSRARSLDWRGEDALFLAGLRVCPNNAKVHYNVAKRFAERGDLAVAVAEYQGRDLPNSYQDFIRISFPVSTAQRSSAQLRT
jgi:hypothetical protein